MLLFDNGRVRKLIRRCDKDDGRSFWLPLDKMNGTLSALPNIKSPYHYNACPNQKISAYQFEERPLSSNFTVRSLFIEIVIVEFQGVQAERISVTTVVSRSFRPPRNRLRKIFGPIQTQRLLAFVLLSWASHSNITSANFMLPKHRYTGCRLPSFPAASSAISAPVWCVPSSKPTQ